MGHPYGPHPYVTITPIKCEPLTKEAFTRYISVDLPHTFPPEGEQNPDTQTHTHTHTQRQTGTQIGLHTHRHRQAHRPTCTCSHKHNMTVTDSTEAGRQTAQPGRLTSDSLKPLHLSGRLTTSKLRAAKLAAKPEACAPLGPAVNSTKRNVTPPNPEKPSPKPPGLMAPPRQQQMRSCRRPRIVLRSNHDPRIQLASDIVIGCVARETSQRCSRIASRM